MMAIMSATPVQPNTPSTSILGHSPPIGARSSCARYKEGSSTGDPTERLAERARKQEQDSADALQAQQGILTDLGDRSSCPNP